MFCRRPQALGGFRCSSSLPCFCPVGVPIAKPVESPLAAVPYALTSKNLAQAGAPVAAAAMRASDRKGAVSVGDGAGVTGRSRDFTRNSRLSWR
jgi:hypothetical protein